MLMKLHHYLKCEIYQLNCSTLLIYICICILLSIVIHFSIFNQFHFHQGDDYDADKILSMHVFLIQTSVTTDHTVVLYPEQFAVSPVLIMPTTFAFHLFFQ